MISNKITVFIYSPQPILRHGVEHLLSLADNIEISPAVEMTAEALSVMDDLPPDVAILDIDGPDGNGLAMARQLKQSLSNIGIIAITSNDNDIRIFEALKAQASACLSKEITSEKLIETVRQVANGEHPINEMLTTHPILADQVLIQFQELSSQGDSKPFISPLTDREIEILKYVAQGWLNKHIATELGIREQTIKNHVSSILRKLNVNARTEAVVLAIKKGLVSIN
jgi:two-component system, NarL family, response regulator DegU